MAAALCSMAGNFTVGKERYADAEADVARLLADADSARLRMLELAEEDARAFKPLARAYGIPKDDPERSEALEKATKEAVEAPLRMMRELCGIIELLEEMGQKGSKMLLSDVGCGASLARAALEMAGFNVFVNTASLQDRAFARAIEEECDGLLRGHLPRTDAVARAVLDSMRGGA